MRIMANIAGTDTCVPVELTSEQTQTIRHEFEKDCISAIIRVYAQKNHPNLTEQELDELKSRCPYPDNENQTFRDFIRDLVNGCFWQATDEEIEDILKGRYKYYCVTVRATQEFDVCVKAASAEDAEAYVNDLDYSDLADYLYDQDHDFEVTGSDNGRDECPHNEADFDATE